MSQISDYENAVTWNPWHGCTKVSAGCANCYVYEQDKRYGRDTATVTRGTTTYKLRAPIGSTVMLCFSSDFFIEDADIWRDACWDEIRYRTDCKFIIPTKRPERIRDCVPDDWGDGWDNVLIIVSIENQEMADKRLAALCDAPALHRGIFCAPLIAYINIEKWLDTGIIEEVSVGGDNAPRYKARPLMYEWVFELYRECKDRGVPFWFHQTGTIFIKDSFDYGESRHGKMIEVANEFADILEGDYVKLQMNMDRAIALTRENINHVIWQSAAIEGIDVNDWNIGDILLNECVDYVSEKDLLFIQNMSDAYQFIFESATLSNDLALLSEFNRICGSNGLIYDAGNLRKLDTSIVGTFWKPDIPDKDVIIAGLRSLNGITDPLFRAMALFCFTARGQFFVDGNKRAAQLIMNKVLIENGIGVLWLKNMDDVYELIKLLIQYYELSNPTEIFNFLQSHIRRV